MAFVSQKGLGRLDSSPRRYLGRLDGAFGESQPRLQGTCELISLLPVVFHRAQCIRVDWPVVSPVTVVVDPSFLETAWGKGLVSARSLEGNIRYLGTTLVQIHVSLLTAEGRDAQGTVRSVGWW